MYRDGMHAFRRFGFGRRGQEPVPADARAWVVSQLDANDPVLGRPGPTIACMDEVLRNYTAAMKSGTSAPGFADLFVDDAVALLNQAVSSDLPLRERLVWFWTNHFTVSARAGNWCFGLIGPYIRDAIRPNVCGRFADLFKAVMRHPGMLYYLDNYISTGPNSPVGLAHHSGLNENLARECLELHTLGVDSGYTQTDVTTLAAILTGRTIDLDGDPPGFRFRADMHEPGPKSFMSRVFPEGYDGSEAALEFIANHPATRHHIATQLVGYFVADLPSADCIQRVEDVLNATGGDLRAAMLTIADVDEAWQPLTKFRAPAEYVVSVLRALSLPPLPKRTIYDATVALGQPFLTASMPNGWPDTTEAWADGELILERAQWAMKQASQAGELDPATVADVTLGDLCSGRTRAAMAACPNKTEALATLLASPEFMRR
jgi:uncharacterized protein (DUF1800 family)